MSLMTIRLELGRTSGAPQGDSQHGYEFVAPLNRDGHLDIAEWASRKDRCGVRAFRPGHSERRGMLRHVGRGWRFDYVPGRTNDDEPFFRLDRHIIAPGLYLTITEEDGIARPFKIVTVKPTRMAPNKDHSDSEMRPKGSAKSAANAFGPPISQNDENPQEHSLRGLD